MADETIPYQEGVDPPKGYILVEMEGKRFWVPRDSVEDGPVRHEELPEGFVKIVRWQWRHLGPYSDIAGFERWELSFLRDADAMPEIVYWTCLTYALLEFVHLYPSAEPATIYKALAAIGVGRPDLVEPEAVRKALERMMREVPSRLLDPDNFTEDGRLIGGGHLE